MSSKQATALARLTNKERQVILEFVKRVHHQFGEQLLAVILFGSRARGEAEPDSDMDVVVLFSNVTLDLRKAIRHLAVELWLEHGIYLSTRVWSEAHWHRLEVLQTQLYRNIQRDGFNLLLT